MSEQHTDEGPIEAEHPVVGEGTLPGPDIAKPVSKARIRFSGFARTVLRWAAGLLIVFLLGALAVYWFLYRPVAEELARVRSEAEQAQQRAAELAGYQVQNEALREEQRVANIQILILGALSDVNAARLALATEDAETAREALSETGRDLTSLANLVGAAYRTQLAAMQDRLNLALNEMNRDPFAAGSDLSVLEANLRQLEAALITGE